MICQLCLHDRATMHLTERSPGGGFEEAQYCAACYEAKCVSPTPSHPFPWPRFTLRNVMTLVGIWAFPNAVVAWVMRSGYVRGTPAQLQQWTIDTFLAVNLILGFFVVWVFLGGWLWRVIWYRRTGDIVPMPVPDHRWSFQRELAMLRKLAPFVGWCFLAAFLSQLITRTLWPVQRSFSLPIFYALLMIANAVAFARRFKRDPDFRDRLRQQWKGASGQERTLRGALFVWTFGFIMVIMLGGPSLLKWGFRPWFPIPPVIIFLILVQLGLVGMLAIATRRR